MSILSKIGIGKKDVEGPKSIGYNGTGLTKLEIMIMLFLQSIRSDIEDYCDLETVSNDTTFVTKQGALITLIEYKGIKSLIGSDTFAEHINKMTGDMMHYFKEKGHSIHLSFRVDYDTPPAIFELNAQQKRSTRKCKLSLDPIIDENSETYASSVFNETCYIALISEPTLLTPVDLKQDGKARKRLLEQIEMPSMVYAQDLLKGSDSLYITHESFVSQFVNTLATEEFPAIFEVLNIVEAGVRIKKQVSPNSTSDDYEISAPAMNTRLPMRWKELPSEGDVSHCLYQPLSEQIMTQAIVPGSSQGSSYPVGSIITDSVVYAPLMVDIPPAKTNSFESLFRLLHQANTYDEFGNIRSIPYCVSFCITGDGMAGTMIKRTLSSIIHFMTAQNKAVNAAGRSLMAVKTSLDQEDTVAGLQMSMMTWAPNTDEGVSLLTGRRQKLWKAFEAWGGTKVMENSGDPILAWGSQIPGLLTQNHAPLCPAPLFDLFYMLPLTRINSPFHKGHQLNRTIDGKLILLDSFSMDLTVWTTINIGKPGTGKSVTMNKGMIDDIMMPGNERIPLCYIIDIGESSRGVVETVQDALPEELRYQAVYARIKNSKDQAINPLEYTMGLRFPLEHEFTQMKSFISSLVTPPEAKGQPFINTSDVVGAILRTVFELANDRNSVNKANRYMRFNDNDLDKIMVKHGLIKEHGSEGRDITYFALRDHFHSIGEERGRALAHRYAMPTVGDMIAAISHPSIVEVYKDTRIGAEPALGFLLQQILNAKNTFPAFFYHTNFDIGNARVASIDLNDVASQSNPKSTSLFFQIVRMFIKRKFAVSSDDLRMFPPEYHDYASAVIRELLEDRKIMSYDELHVAGGDPVLLQELEEDARTLRKWGARLNLASHQVSDFRNLVKFATAYVIVDPGTRESREELCASIGLTDLEMEALGSGAVGFSQHGLTYFSRIKTASMECSGLYTLSVGPIQLWSLSTQPDERSLRNYTYDLLGDRNLAKKVLAQFYPRGAKNQINTRKKAIEKNTASRGGEFDEAKATQSIIATMASEMVASYHKYEMEQNFENTLKKANKSAKKKNAANQSAEGA